MATADVDDGGSLLQNFDEDDGPFLQLLDKPRQEVGGDEDKALDLAAGRIFAEFVHTASAEAANKSTLHPKYPQERKDEEQKRPEENQRDCLKRGYAREKDSGGKETKKKKQKKHDGEKKNMGKKQKKNPVNEKPGKTNFARLGLEPATQIPPEWRDKIKGKEGHDVKLVITKQIFKTDVSPHHRRLQIPCNQIRNEFLSMGEKRILRLHEVEKGIPVNLMEPCGFESDIQLRQWNSKNTINYVLTGGAKWNEVLDRNLTVWDEKNKKWIMKQFKVNDIIQIWLFRVDGQLWLALIKVWEEPLDVNATSPTGSGGASTSRSTVVDQEEEDKLDS